MKLKIGMRVDIGPTEVNIMVSKFVDQREPQKEPKRAENEPKIKVFKICRVGASWQGMVQERSSVQFLKMFSLIHAPGHALKSKNSIF